MQVVIAEDDPVTRFGLDTVLREWGYQTVIVNDGQAALAALRAPQAPMLAVIDWLMPKLNGIDVCRQLRAEEENRYTYLIILTSKNDSIDVVSALHAGADDFVTKPFDLAELKERLGAGLRIVELQEKLRDLASHDALTGLLNRRLIGEMLQHEVERTQRDGKPIAVMMIDLDHFKRVNDSHGHQAGDEVLREAARRIKSVLRTVDFIGRYGGEEFLAVLPGCNPDFALEVAERMRATIASHPVFAMNISLNVTASIGVAVVIPDNQISAEELLREADVALYRAKATGRNRVAMLDFNGNSAAANAEDAVQPHP